MSPSLLPFCDQCQFFVRSSSAGGLQCAATKLATRAAVPDSSFNGSARAVRAFVASPAFASVMQMMMPPYDTANEPEDEMSLGGGKQSSTVFCDPVAKQVLYVYSLPPQKPRLEFIQFC